MTPKQEAFVREYLLDWLHVDPARSGDDLGDRALAHAITECELSLGDGSGTVLSPDSQDIEFPELRSWVGSPALHVVRTCVRCVSALRRHVGVVIAAGACEKVVRSYAPRVVTSVADARRQVAIGKCESGAMSKRRHSPPSLSHVEATVAVGIECPDPLPAGVTFGATNERSETIRQVFRGGRHG